MATSPYGNLMHLRNVTHAIGGVPVGMQGQSTFPPVHAVGPAGGFMGNAGGGYMPPNTGMGGAGVSIPGTGMSGIYPGQPIAHPVGPAGGFMGSAGGGYQSPNMGMGGIPQNGPSIPGTGMGGIYPGQPVAHPVGPAGGSIGSIPGQPGGQQGGMMGGWGSGYGGVHAVGPEPYGGASFSGYGGLGLGARPVGPAGGYGATPNYQNLMMLQRMGY